MTSGITLLVDIGNSRVKWAQVNGQNLTGLGEAAHGESPTHALKAMADAQPEDISRLTVTNVGGGTIQLILNDLAKERWGLTPEFVTPRKEAHGVRCSYPDPSRLGADRWAALIAARQFAPGSACVIDSGTTVTLDALDHNGQHLGGLIMAGPRIVSGALERETSGIGETSGTPGTPVGIEVLGTNTEDAVAKGVMLGLAGAVDRALDAVAKEVQGELTVYITGGDALVLSAWLETETQFRANLVLEGLAFIAAES